MGTGRGAGLRVGLESSCLGCVSCAQRHILASASAASELTEPSCLQPSACGCEGGRGRGREVEATGATQDSWEGAEGWVSGGGGGMSQRGAWWPWPGGREAAEVGWWRCSEPCGGLEELAVPSRVGVMWAYSSAWAAIEDGPEPLGGLADACFSQL